MGSAAGGDVDVRDLRERYAECAQERRERDKNQEQHTRNHLLLVGIAVDSFYNYLRQRELKTNN